MNAIFVGVEQDTPEWHEWRQRGGEGNPFPAAVGGSDAPVILGSSKYKTPDQLWAEKSGLVVPEPATYIMQRGKDFEPDIRRAYIETTGMIVTPCCLIHKKHQWMIASLDGMTIDGTVIVEIKLNGGANHELALAGIIPPAHFVQIQHNLAVTDAQFADYVSCYYPPGRAGFVPKWPLGSTTYVACERNDEFIESLFKEEFQFLQCVARGVKPSDARKEFYAES